MPVITNNFVKNKKLFTLIQFFFIFIGLFYFAHNALAVRSAKVGTGTFKSSAGQLTQAPLNFDIGSLTWSAGNTASLPIGSGGSGSGDITYTSTTPSVCSVLNNVVTALSSGTCTIQATKAGDANYTSIAVLSNVAVNIDQNQNLVVTSDKASLKIQHSGACNTGEKTNLTTTGVMCDSPSVTYSTSTPDKCSVSGNSVTILSATGSCLITASQPACSGYRAATASFSIPAGGYVSTSISISASPLTGNAGSKANATVTIINGIPPYNIACNTSDYRANCNITSNDGTNTTTTGSGSGAGAKTSPIIYGGTGNSFNVQAWALYTKAVVGASGFSGNAAFSVYDSGCYNGTPFAATSQVYAPN